LSTRKILELQSGQDTKNSTISQFPALPNRPFILPHQRCAGKRLLEFRDVPEGNLDRLKKASLSKKETAMEKLKSLRSPTYDASFGSQVLPQENRLDKLYRSHVA